MSHSDHSTPATSQPPRQRPWWVDTLLLIGCLAVAEISLHYAIELADLDMSALARSLFDAFCLALLIGPLFAWLIYRRHVDIRLALEKLRHSGKASNSPHKRVRVAVLGSLAVIAALMAVSLWGHVTTTARMARSAEIVNLAGRQRTHTQRVARFAEGAIDRPLRADSMNVAAGRLQSDARKLVAITATFEVEVFRAAREAREALSSSQTLRDSLLDATRRVTEFPLGSVARRAAVGDVGRIADRLLSAAESTVDALQRYSEERVRRSVRSSWVIALLVQIVIAIIALLVIEPVVKLLEQQYQTAMARSVEFQRLAMVAERTSNAVIMTDASRRITWVNDGFVRLTGYTLDEALGKSPATLLQCANTDAATVGLIRSALDAGSSIRCEVLNRDKHGSEYWLDIAIEPLHENGVLSGFIAIETEITEQVRTREALARQSQLAQEAYIDSQRATVLLEEAQTVASLGSWSFDLTTSRVEWSRAMFRLYGREEESGAPSFDQELIDYIPADALRLQHAVALALSAATPYSLVLKMSHGKNGVRYVRTEGRTVTSTNGNVTRLFGTVMDVTAAVEREEELRQAQTRAEAASQSKSEFLANMSHEIRTPLTAILGFTDLLRDEAIRHGASDEQLHSMTTIRRAGEHLLTVINDILDLSKIEAGRMAIERVETDLPRVLFDVDSLMRSRAAQKGVQLHTRLLSPIFTPASTRAWRST